MVSIFRLATALYILKSHIPLLSSINLALFLRYLVNRSDSSTYLSSIMNLKGNISHSTCIFYKEARAGFIATSESSNIGHFPIGYICIDIPVHFDSAEDKCYTM